jgi:uncharacterized membrane protein
MKKVVNFLLILLLISLVSADNHIGVNYNLIEDKAFVEINFGQVINFEFKLPYDVRTFESNSDYEIIDFEDYKLLKVGYSNDLQVSYITNSVIDKSSNKNYFVLNNNFNGSINFTLALPEGAVLENLIFPDYDSITTDGKKIILKWEDFDSEEIVVSYKNAKGSDSFWFYFLMLLIIIFSVFYVYQAKKFKRRMIQLKVQTHKSKDEKKKDVTRNLFGEEKKIIEYLLDKKGHACWTKEIVRELGISKVRLSRKLRNLKQKDLIEKIPHGNENRIKLLKTH